MWIKDTANDHEGNTDITLNYENSIELSGNDALTLVSKIIPHNANTNSAESYTFNSGATRNNGVDCTISIKSPSESSGSITIGLLKAIPASIPESSEAIDFGFYFDTRAATIGTGNFEITIAWDDQDINLESSDNPGLFISEDGSKWINTDNYANGTSEFSWADNSRVTDQVYFKIDHLPNSIVFGDGVERTYTESTPDTPASLMFYEIDDDGLTLQWVPSSLPDEDYEIQKSSAPYSDWTTISSPTISNVGSVKQYEVTTLAADTYFYRVKAINHSSGSSSYNTVGYHKNSLISGWNLVSYALGGENYNVKGFYDDISNIADDDAIKIWDYDTQSWIIKAASVNAEIELGNCFMVKTTASGSWYNRGLVPSSGMDFTLTYTSGLSGYNVVMRPWGESSATTISGLHNTLFGGSITDGARTISWFDATAEGICIYDGYKLISSSSISPGQPLIIHLKSGDVDITWP